VWEDVRTDITGLAYETVEQVTAQRGREIKKTDECEIFIYINPSVIAIMKRL
jgi:hypothetical protein